MIFKAGTISKRIRYGVDIILIIIQIQLYHYKHVHFSFIFKALVNYINNSLGRKGFWIVDCGIWVGLALQEICVLLLREEMTFSLTLFIC